MKVLGVKNLFKVLKMSGTEYSLTRSEFVRTYLYFILYLVVETASITFGVIYHRLESYLFMIAVSLVLTVVKMVLKLSIFHLATFLKLEKVNLKSFENM